MDSRMDVVAKAVARGTTRRQALRLAGGGLAGALLAAAGLGKRAGAQENGPEFTDCRSSGGPLITGIGTDEFRITKPCGPTGGCPDGKVCAALVNPVGQILCRCLSVE